MLWGREGIEWVFVGVLREGEEWGGPRFRVFNAQRMLSLACVKLRRIWDGDIFTDSYVVIQKSLAGLHPNYCTTYAANVNFEIEVIGHWVN